MELEAPVSHFKKKESCSTSVTSHITYALSRETFYKSRQTNTHTNQIIIFLAPHAVCLSRSVLRNAWSSSLDGIHQARRQRTQQQVPETIEGSDMNRWASAAFLIIGASDVPYWIIAFLNHNHLPYEFVILLLANHIRSTWRAQINRATTHQWFMQDIFSLTFRIR